MVAVAVTVTVAQAWPHPPALVSHAVPTKPRRLLQTIPLAAGARRRRGWPKTRTAPA